MSEFKTIPVLGIPVLGKKRNASDSDSDSDLNEKKIEIEILEELEREIEIDTKKQKIEEVKTIPSNYKCNISKESNQLIDGVVKGVVKDIQGLTDSLETNIVNVIVESASNKNSRITSQNVSQNVSQNASQNASQNPDDDIQFDDDSQPDININYGNMDEGADIYNMVGLNNILSPIETVFSNLFSNQKIKKALTTGCGIAIVNYIVPYLLPTALYTGKFMIKHSLTSLSLLFVALRTIGNDSNDNIVEIRKYIMGEITAVLHGLFNVILLTQEIKQETMTEIHNFIVGLKKYEIHIKTTGNIEQGATNVQQDELNELIEESEGLIAEYEEKIKQLKGGKKKSKKQSKKKSKKQSKKKSKKQGQKKSRKQKK
jgi:hypothetical protein